MVVELASSMLKRQVQSQHVWAVNKLRQFGAQISRNQKTVTTIRLDQNWRGGDEGLVYLPEVNGLEEVYLERSSVTDRGLATVATIPKLKKLYLAKTQINGEGLGYLAKAPELTFLSLKGVPLEGDAFESLSKVTQLLELGLDDTLADDVSMQHLSLIHI